MVPEKKRINPISFGFLQLVMVSHWHSFLYSPLPFPVVPQNQLFLPTLFTKLLYSLILAPTPSHFLTISSTPPYSPTLSYTSQNYSVSTTQYYTSVYSTTLLLSIPPHPPLPLHTHLYSTAPPSTPLHPPVLYRTRLYSTAPVSTPPYPPLLHPTPLYSTLPPSTLPHLPLLRRTSLYSAAPSSTPPHPLLVRHTPLYPTAPLSTPSHSPFLTHTPLYSVTLPSTPLRCL